MAKQKIETIKVVDLHLWSENPRDPVNPKSSDFDIIKHAVDENPNEWNLDKLVKEMGKYYDFSEIPTVVIIDTKPVVFDGNRRIAVLKYLQDRELYSSLTGRLFFGDGPKELRELLEIPCNVCDKDTALTNIERKHVNNGSWGVLQREYFLHQHRGQPKSLFLILEDQTGLISGRPFLNKRFVKEEVFTEKNLKEIGFGIEGDKLVSNYDNEKQSIDILEKASSLIESEDVTTRKKRGSLKQALLERYPEINKEITVFDNTKRKNNVVGHQFDSEYKFKRRTPIAKQSNVLFGKTLSLKSSQTNNLYRAIDRIYSQNQNDDTILPVIGMSLRLLLEVAGREYFAYSSDDEKRSFASEDKVCEKFLKEAKKELNQLDKNNISLTNEWLSDKINLNAILQKYAHGSITYTRDGILVTSKIVADILEHYFKK